MLSERVVTLFVGTIRWLQPFSVWISCEQQGQKLPKSDRVGCLCTEPIHSRRGHSGNCSTVGYTPEIVLKDVSEYE
jgi:hypothetical protein